MRLLIQRVSRASVSVDRQIVGSIGGGLLVLFGVGTEDTTAECDELAAKLVRLRIFEDEDGKMNLDLVQTGASVLIVSQFTLFGDTRRGNRPSFTAAARPEQAEILYEQFVEQLRTYLGPERVATGRFGAMMDVELVNQGPVTIWIDSQQ